jgi:hypothetical protein
MYAAVREIWSNARDLPGATIQYDAGIVTIEDQSTGIPIKALKLGFSENRHNDNTAGQFGEGMKLAALISVRESRQFHIDTVGWQTTFSAPNSEDFGELFQADILPSNRDQGTRITIEVSQDEYDRAVGLFREFNPDITNVTDYIISKPAIFSVGIQLDVWKGFYGYEIGKLAANHRDREGLATELKRTNVARILKATTDPNVIYRLLTGYEDLPDAEEYQVGYCYPNDPNVWGEVVTSRFGTKVAVSTDQSSDYIASAQGYTIIAQDAPTFVKNMLSYAGIKSAKNVIKPNDPAHINWKDLQAEYRNRFRAIVELAERLNVRAYEYGSYEEHCGKAPQIKCFSQDNPQNANWSQANGIYVPATNTVWIAEQVLWNRESCIGTALHEFAHCISGGADFTEEFQQGLTRLAGRMAFMPVLRVL